MFRLAGLLESGVCEAASDISDFSQKEVGFSDVLPKPNLLVSILAVAKIPISLSP